MLTAINYLKRKHGLPDNANMHSWLRANKISHVTCSFCGMRISIHEAYADKKGYVFCLDCTYETNKSNPPMQLLEDAKRATIEARKRRR